MTRAIEVDGMGGAEITRSFSGINGHTFKVVQGISLIKMWKWVESRRYSVATSYRKDA